MENLFKNIFIFTTGAFVGASVTYYFMNKKCKLLEEDIEEARNLYLNANNEPKVYAEVRKPDEKPSLEELTNYNNKVQDLGYSKDEFVEGAPHIIEPGEYGALDGYEEHTLTYWADDILSDDDTDEKIEDIDDVVGIEILDMLEYYDDGVIHVRNDNLKADYEIVKDSRNYADVIGDEVMEE